MVSADQGVECKAYLSLSHIPEPLLLVPGGDGVRQLIQGLERTLVGQTLGLEDECRPGVELTLAGSDDLDVERFEFVQIF